MTDGNGSRKSKNSNDNTEDEDWEFTICAVIPSAKNDKAKSGGEAKTKNPRTFKSENLSLDDASVPKTKTRSAMAIEMQGVRGGELKDEFNLAPFSKRALAFGFDMILLAGIIFAIKFSSPLLRKLIQYYMDHNNLKFMVSELTVMNSIRGITGFFAIFFLILIPVAFFNSSFGKKILGLRVRGKEQYTISISEAFKRELLLKPLSIVIIAGFITPFYSKNRLSIHDMLVDTIVIDD